MCNDYKDFGGLYACIHVDNRTYFNGMLWALKKHSFGTTMNKGVYKIDVVIGFTVS